MHCLLRYERGILLDFLELGQAVNSYCYNTMLTKQKAQTSKVRPEKKTIFFLKQNNTRSHTSFNIVQHIASLGWTILPHPVDRPSGFDLFRPMKNGLHGQRFPSSHAVIAPVNQWVTSIDIDRMYYFQSNLHSIV